MFFGFSPCCPGRHRGQPAFADRARRADKAAASLHRLRRPPTSAAARPFKSALPSSAELEQIAEAKAKLLARPTPEWLPKPVIDIPEAKAADAAGMKAYVEQVPGTDAKFKMVPIPGGKFMMGSPATEKGHQAGRRPAARGRRRALLDGRARGHLGRIRVVVAGPRQAAAEVQQDRDHRSRQAGRRRGRAHQPLSGDVVRHGQGRHAGDLHDAVRRQGLLPLALGQDRPLLPPADRGRMGIRLPRRQDRPPTVSATIPAKLGEYAWFTDNSDDKYHRVATKKPNPWGLYDMHGNVSEWVIDQYVADFYGKTAGKVGRQPAWPPTPRNIGRVVRGGSWDDDAEKCRSATRRASEKDWKKQDPQIPQSIWYLTDATFVGFRVIRPLRVPTAEEAKKYEVDEDQLTAYKEYVMAQANKQ